LAPKNKFNFIVKDVTKNSNVTAILDISEDSCEFSEAPVTSNPDDSTHTPLGDCDNLPPVESTQRVTKNAPPEESHVFEKTVRSIAQNLECAVCFEYMNLAHTVVPCGHPFCFMCIDDWSSKSEMCPSCQGPLEDINPSLFIDSTVRNILVASTDQDALTTYDERTTESREYKKSKSMASSIAAPQPGVASLIQQKNILPAKRISGSILRGRSSEVNTASAREKRQKTLNVSRSALSSTPFSSAATSIASTSISNVPLPAAASSLFRSSLSSSSSSAMVRNLYQSSGEEMGRGSNKSTVVCIDSDGHAPVLPRRSSSSTSTSSTAVMDLTLDD
jgi:hypothetical protein